MTEREKNAVGDDMKDLLVEIEGLEFTLKDVCLGAVGYACERTAEKARKQLAKIKRGLRTCTDRINKAKLV